VLAYVVDIANAALFWLSCLMTFIALIVVGLLKSFVTETSKLRGIINTVAPGGIVALIAYYVGDVLEGIIQAF